MTLSKKRNNFFDIMKGVAIILVIIGHNIQFGSGLQFYETASYYENVIFRFIYSFHMPLFMMISGYFFYSSIKKYPIKDLFRSKIKSLLIPILCWSIIPICFITLKMILNHTSFQIDFIWTCIKTILCNLWFLWAILYCSIIVLLNHKFFNDSIFVYFIILILCFFITDDLNFVLYKYMYPYFVFGYFANKKGLLTKLQSLLTNQKISFIYFLINIILYILLFLNFNHTSYIYTSKMSVLDQFEIEMFGIAIFRWMIGFVGAILITSLIYYIYNRFENRQTAFQKALVFCGINSLSFYIIDNLLNMYILLKVTSGFELNYIITMIETFFVLIICIIGNKIIKKIPIFDRLLLGAR